MKVDNILIVSNTYPSASYKRAGVFTKQDADFFLGFGCKVKILIANRYILSPKRILNSLFDKNIEELRKLSNENHDVKMTILRYFSLPKPFVFREDLFLWFKKIKSKDEYDVILCEFMLE